MFFTQCIHQNKTLVIKDVVMNKEPKIHPDDEPLPDLNAYDD